MRRVWTVCVHEYLTNVRRKEFLFMTLGLPVLMLFFGGLSALGTMMASTAVSKGAPRDIGIVDRSGVLSRQIDVSLPGSTENVRLFTSEERGKAALTRRSIDSLTVLDPDYLATGKATVYRRAGGVLSSGNRPHIGTPLAHMLLARSGADTRIAARAMEPFGSSGPTILTQTRNGTFEPQNAGKEIARFAVPYFFTILLTMAIFFSASYLLRGVSDEKENRVIEVILSSVSARELLFGKLIGLGAVGLTQVAIWCLLGAVPVMARFGQYVHVPPAGIVGAIVFFLLGYALYATLMVGIGSLGTTYRESQQISGIVSFGAFMPFVFIPVLIEAPNDMLARVFSWIPFTAPTTMVLRMTATEVPVVDIVVSILLLLGTTWAALTFSAKLFRFGLLIYGKRPTFGETFRMLRQA